MLVALPCPADTPSFHSVCWIYLPHGIIFKVSSNKVACGDPCYDRKVCTWDCNSYSLLSYFPSKERAHFCVYLHSHALSDWLMKLITLTFLTKVSCKTGSIFLDASAFLCMTQWVDCTSRFSFGICTMSPFIDLSSVQLCQYRNWCRISSSEHFYRRMH